MNQGTAHIRRRHAGLIVAASFGLLLVAGPAALAQVDPGPILDPVQSTLPSPQASVGTPAESVTDPVSGTVSGVVGTVSGVAPGAPKPPGLPAAGDGESQPGRGGQSDGGRVTRSGGDGGADTAGSIGTGSGSVAGTTASVSGAAAGGSAAEESGGLHTQIGTLASNAAALTRPLALPLGIALAAVAALILATRRPHRLAKLDDEGTWGYDRTTWRL